MTPTSWFFILIFAIPYVAFLFWLMKQDKRKGVWGAIVLVLILALAIFGSSIGSKKAVFDYETRRDEAREQSVE